LEHGTYREIYAATIVEAGNDTDAKYMLKTAIYQAAFAAITEGGNGTDIVEKLLREIPHCRVPVANFKLACAIGWPAARGLLGKHFAKIFELVLSGPELVKEMEDKMALGEWLLAFEQYPLKDDVSDEI
jgi:hypothetical protein